MKIKNTITYFKKHKIRATLLLLVVVLIAYGAYRTFGAGSAQTRYVIGEVSTGTITTSVTGSGQVSASNQVELKSKASGDIAVLAVKNGQRVTAGQLIARVESVVGGCKQFLSPNWNRADSDRDGRIGKVTVLGRIFHADINTDNIAFFQAARWQSRSMDDFIID
jgi:hypothetical protein